MPLSPQDIEHKDFLVTLRGYDKDEVKAFLKTLAADYARALDGGADPPSAESAYQAWGQEMADLLQQATKAAERITATATEEAALLRAKAENEAARLRETARDAAARVTEEAERHAEKMRADADRYAHDVRTQAESDATQRFADVTKRVERLQATEDSVRTRLGSLEEVLSAMRNDLRPHEEAGVIDLSPQEPDHRETSGRPSPEGTP